MRSRNNNQSDSSLVQEVKVTRINSQVTTNGYKIDGPDPGTMAVNDLDTNVDKCCIGANFTVLQMTLRASGVYPYNSS